MSAPVAITLTQPWASLVVYGRKRIETRSWRTRHRGKLGIHAAKGLTSIGGLSGFRELCHRPHFKGALEDLVPDDGSDDMGVRIFVDDMPRGVLLGTVELLDCVPTSEVLPIVSEQERAFGDYTEGRWAWLLEDPVPLLAPIPMGGQLSVWPLPEGIDV